MRLAVHPVGACEQAVATANAFASQVKHPIKVLCMGLREMLASMGLTEARFIDGIHPRRNRSFGSSPLTSA